MVKELYENAPARHWAECYPLGNGNIGVMNNCDFNDMMLWFNDDRLWSGCNKNRARRVSAEQLDAIRAAVNAERFADAEKFIVDNVNGEFTESYLPLGSLNIKSDLPAYRIYKRSLSLDTAVETAETESAKFEQFVSAPARCHIMKINYNTRCNIEISAASEIRCEVNYNAAEYGAIIAIKGVAPSHCDPVYRQTENAVVYDETEKGSDFVMLTGISTDGAVTGCGGCIKISEPSFIKIVTVTEVELNPTGVLETAAKARLESIIGGDYDKILGEHVADYKKLYDNCALDLGADNESPEPVSAMLKKPIKSRGNALYEFLFDYGKYLLISSSRAGTAAANLQGIWNKEFKPPWSSNYTININTQMNYWGAEAVGLGELHAPLFDLIEKIRVKGETVARETFGCRGWVCGHNSDFWGHANPVGEDSAGSVGYSLCMTSGAWLCRHIFEHYEYTLDKDFLRDKLDTLEGAAMFLLDFLTVDDKTGKLVPNPSASPENRYRIRFGAFAVNKASTMDITVIRELFKNVIKAHEILGVESELTEEIKTALAELLPYRVNRAGRIQEWYDDYRETDKRHRHVSHLYGLYPGKEFNFCDTPELAGAAKKSLARRGYKSTGWAIAWRIALYARLLDGESALRALDAQLRYVDAARGMGLYGGTYSSLLCAHPPFQIDGNFGAAAAIAEMLMQSHNGYIEILPALPKKWADGSVRGLRARGGYTVDIEWKNGKAVRYEINSAINDRVKVLEGGEVRDYPIPYVFNGNEA